VSHLKQIGVAMHMYSGDWCEWWPPSLSALVPLYMSDDRALRCPDRRQAHPSGVDYVYLPVPFWGSPHQPLPIACDRPDNRRDGRVHLLFENGRVKTFDKAELERSRLAPRWFQERRPPPDSELEWCLRSATTGQGRERWVALYGLALRRDPRALPGVLEVVRTGLLIDGMPVYGTRLALTFGREAVPALISALHRAGNEAERVRFVSALGYMGDKRAVPAVESQLASGEESTVRMACRALGQIGAADSWVALCRVLEQGWPDRRADACQHAATALGQLRHPAAVAHLCLHVAKRTPNAVAALHDTGSPEALASLCSLIRHEPVRVVGDLVWGMRAPRDVRLAPVLVWVLRQPRAQDAWFVARDVSIFLRNCTGEGRVAKPDTWQQVQDEWLRWWEGPGKPWWRSRLTSASTASSPERWLAFASDGNAPRLSWLSSDAPPGLQVCAMLTLTPPVDSRAQAFLLQASKDPRWPVRAAAQLVLDRAPR